MIRILFVDDDPQAHKIMKMVLEDGYVIRSAYTGRQGLELLLGDAPDVILLDIDLPDQSGMDVLREILSIPLAPPVIMLTVFNDVRLAVDAIRAGAHDYVVKPYDLRQLTGTIRKAVQDRSRPRETGQAGCPAMDRIVGQSGAIAKVRELIERFGRSEYPVLITGESGTGKELVAQALHAVSSRSGPFVALNCGAIPGTLVESELFGTEKGAFTDSRSRTGLFEQAEGGTLFLDEIGEMPGSAQVKLLRILEDKQVSRVGSASSRQVNVRVVSATNRKKEDQEAVRRDLYYRLGVLTIELPPLRERTEDIPLLAGHFLADLDRGRSLNTDAIEKLRQHEWPGNVRELRNTIARAIVLADGEEIRAVDIQHE